MSQLAAGKSSRRHPGQERGLGGRGGGRRREWPAWRGNGGHGRTLRLQHPQRAAVEHRGLGELAVAEALVAGGAEPVHGVCELGAHPGPGRRTGGRVRYRAEACATASEREHRLART